MNKIIRSRGARRVLAAAAALLVGGWIAAGSAIPASAAPAAPAAPEQELAHRLPGDSS